MLGYALAILPLFLLAFAGLWYLVYRIHSQSVNLVASISIAAVLCAIFVPSSYSITKTIVQNSAVAGFKEYFNGWETGASKREQTCVLNGSCYNEYECNSRLVPEPYINSKGESAVRWVEKHDMCPYSTQETTYYVTTTLGNNVIAASVMTGDRFKTRTSIPGGQQTTPPARWTEVADRIKANKPDPVVKVSTYDNLLLGASLNFYENNSDKVATMLEQNVLPTVSTGFYDFYRADKMYTVPGMDVSKLARYKDDVAKLNGAFGQELRGDLHVVFAPSDLTDDPKAYVETLKAYWQSDHFDRNSLAKNTLLVVLGIDGEKVVWADATTGMPAGNEGLSIDIRELMIGKKLDENLIGSPAFDIHSNQVVHSKGALENVIWGDNKFERQTMEGGDADDVGVNYKFLKEAIQPSTGNLVFTGIFSSLIAGGLFFGALMLMVNYGAFPYRHRNNDYRY